MSLFTGKNRLLAGTLLAGVAFGGIAAPAAAQQQPSAPADTSASTSTEIVVTGSRLRRENFDSPNPTVGVGAAELDDKQVANLVDSIEDIPLIGIGSNNRGTQTQNGDSYAFPDVLDLGTQRTLTLLNGRRVVASNQGTLFVPGNATGSQVDLSMIPPTLIERVEVVAGTGGAVYGADAVAGVVNIITKQDYEGAELRVQGGFPELGEGNSYRASGLWGKNFFNGKANLTLTGDYFKQDAIFSSKDTAQLYGGSTATNLLDSGIRRTDFSLSGAIARLNGSNCEAGAATAAAALAQCNTQISNFSAFLPSNANGAATNYLGPLDLRNPLLSLGGTIVTNQNFASGFSTATALVPAAPVGVTLANAAADPAGFAFFAPSALTTGQSTNPNPILTSFGVSAGDIAALTLPQRQSLALSLLQRNRPTPYEYFAANPSLNPLLFIGTFGTNSGGGQNLTNGFLPTIANTDPATSTLFPRVAVPLQFNASGQLVPFNVGNIRAPLQAQYGTVFGGDGYDPFALGFSQVQAGTERMSFGGQSNFEITKNIKAKTEFLYTKATYEQVQGPSTNVPGASPQNGQLAVPIFIDQNPFFGSANLATINSLVAQGMALPPTIGGQRVLYMTRALSDIVGGQGLKSETEAETFRIAQVFEGDFNFLSRNFYWDVSAVYGRAQANNNRVDIGDVEFRLATDVVTGPNGQPVCRQQTLAAPESITVRDPVTSSIVIASGLLTPTAAQVANCVPLNLFGNNASSAAARKYVLVDASTQNINTQESYAGSLAGDLIDLPAGPFQVGINVEQRRDSAEFEPNRQLSNGAGRTALQLRGQGELQFTEYGVEANLPIFGDDFNFPGFRSLELSYAFRQVEREQSSETAVSAGFGKDDDTFSYSFKWKPVDELTLRGARTRTVRSADLVQLVGPFGIANTGPDNTYHPCSVTNIDTGPLGPTRRANCVAAVQALGIAATPAAATTFLSTFTNASVVGGNRTAVAQGNPNLANEEGNSYTFGFTWEPDYIPRFVLSADFFSVDLKNELTLLGPFGGSGSVGAFMGLCFESATYPNVPVGGVNACDQFAFGTLTGGSYINPAVNAITGNASIAGPVAGTPAIAQQPFQASLAAFKNLNLGGRSVRAVNLEARYNFGLEELPVVGEALKDFGDIYLRTSVFQTQRYDVFVDPTLRTLADRLGGEHTNPKYEVRTDIRHKVGNFDQTLQWFWNSRTVTNITVGKNLYPEQSLLFIAPAFHFFNYNASYSVNDQLALRLTVNNLTDTDEPRGKYGATNQYDGGIGREFIVGASYKF